VSEYFIKKNDKGELVVVTKTPNIQGNIKETTETYDPNKPRESFINRFNRKFEESPINKFFEESKATEYFGAPLEAVVMDLMDEEKLANYKPVYIKPEKYGTPEDIAKSQLENTIGLGSVVTAIKQPITAVQGGVYSTGAQVVSNIKNKRPLTEGLDEAAKRGVETSAVLVLTNAATNKILSNIASKFVPSAAKKITALTSGNVQVPFKYSKQATDQLLKNKLFKEGVKRVIARAIVEVPAESAAFGTIEGIKNKENVIKSIVREIPDSLVGNLLFAGLNIGYEGADIYLGDIFKQLGGVIKNNVKQLGVDESGFINPKAKLGRISIPDRKLIEKYQNDIDVRNRNLGKGDEPVAFTRIKPESLNEYLKMRELANSLNVPFDAKTMQSEESYRNYRHLTDQAREINSYLDRLRAGYDISEFTSNPRAAEFSNIEPKYLDMLRKIKVANNQLKYTLSDNNFGKNIQDTKITEIKPNTNLKIKPDNDPEYVGELVRSGWKSSVVNPNKELLINSFNKYYDRPVDFKTKTSMFDKSEETMFKNKLISEFNEGAVDKVAGAIEESQKTLRNLYPEGKVTLYRGVNNKNITDNADYTSWTDKKPIAEKFAGKSGKVITKEIPIEDIVLSYKTIPWLNNQVPNGNIFMATGGLSPEYEFIVKNFKSKIKPQDLKVKQSGKTWYHGTGEKQMSSIDVEGFKPQNDLYSYFTDNEANAKKYASIGDMGAGKNEFEDILKAQEIKANKADSDLLSEAKKYKSAEEFIKAQGTPVYHGTNYANARKIQKEGINPENAGAIQEWMKGNKYSFFTGDEKYAQSYGIQKGGGDTKSGRSFVLAIKSPKDIQIETSTFKKGMKFPDLVSQQKINPENIYIKGIDNKWYPIKEFNFFTGESDTFMGKTKLDELPIKTKSQLIDIWNQANKADSDLLSEAKKYKSADEFVNSQGKILYHGTSADYPVDEFKGGYLTEDKKYADIYQRPSTSSLGQAEALNAKYKGTPKTIEFVLDKKAKIFDYQNPQHRALINDYWQTMSTSGEPVVGESGQLDWTEGESLAEFLEMKELNFDGIKLDEGGGIDPISGLKVKRAPSIRILNPKVLKTKSQLIDIWNQANKAGGGVKIPEDLGTQKVGKTH